MSRPLALAGPVALVVLSLGLPARGQGVGDAALREKTRRERSAAAPSSGPPKTITDEDLRRRAEQPPPDAGAPAPDAGAPPADGGAPAPDALAPAPGAGAPPPDAGAPPPQAEAAPPVAPLDSSPVGARSAALLRHLASAEAYLGRCERRLTEARERWLSASEANEPRATEKARLEFEAAGRELERARAYRDEAETAARRAGVQPAGE